MPHIHGHIIVSASKGVVSHLPLVMPATSLFSGPMKIYMESKNCYLAVKIHVVKGTFPASCIAK